MIKWIIKEIVASAVIGGIVWFIARLFGAEWGYFEVVRALLIVDIIIGGIGKLAGAGDRILDKYKYL